MVKKTKSKATPDPERIVVSPGEFIAMKSLLGIVSLLEDSSGKKLSSIIDICKQAETELQKDGVIEAIGKIINDTINSIQAYVDSHKLEYKTEPDEAVADTLRLLRRGLSRGYLERYYQEWMNADDQPGFLVGSDNYMPLLEQSFRQFCRVLS